MVYEQNISKVKSISQTNKPLAIVMWDYSWILRHHRYGEFENWDQVLQGLVERGYDAIRIDAMTQFIASSKDGTITEEYRSVKDGWIPAMWGNDYTMSFRPREALVEFLTLCRKHHIQVGLASWFLPHGTGQTDIFMEQGGLFRAWDETLAFLDSHHLLDNNIIYVDVLNEYPTTNGYDWMKQEMNLRSDAKKFKLSNPEANVPDPDTAGLPANFLQKEFYNQFANDILSRLKAKYPALDFFVSLDSGMSLENIDLTNFAALDYHIWFHHHNDIPGMGEIGKRDQTQIDYRMTMKNLQTFWAANKERLINWMNGRMNDISQAAAKHGIVCGNTEGWGPIFWFDHPELDWYWVKESAEVCIELLPQYPNYKFICTSNFTHPQFKGLWEDIRWHREMTRKIHGAG
jgi:hypothetical protein